MNGLAVPIRSLRMEDELWGRLGERVHEEPEPAWRSRAAVIRALAEQYATYPAGIETLLRDLRNITDIRATLHDMQDGDGGG